MPQYDPCKYTYPSRRNVVYAKNGMACTSVPLGAQVGLGVLKAGGNAMDAAVAMAAGMPCSSPPATAWGRTPSPWCGWRKRKHFTALTPAGWPRRPSVQML